MMASTWLRYRRCEGYRRAQSPVEAFAFAYEFPHYINTNNPELRRLQNVGAYLKSVVPPDKRILAYDTSVIFGRSTTEW